MKGKILSYDIKYDQGLIVTENNNHYYFKLADWHGGGIPEVDMMICLNHFGNNLLSKHNDTPTITSLNNNRYKPATVTARNLPCLTYVNKMNEIEEGKSKELSQPRKINSLIYSLIYIILLISSFILGLVYVST